MKKRTISAFLALAMLASLNACAQSSGDPVSDSEDSTTAETESPYDSNGYLKDNLPADLDFGGETVNIYVRGDNLASEFDPESDGDVVNEAIYKRNAVIEERLNVDLSYFTNTTNDFWGDRDKFMDTVRGSVMANDGTIDLVGALSLMAPYMAQESLFYNLLADDMPYLEFDQPWWSSSLTDELAIGDKLYYASGEASLGLVKGLFCIYYNKDLIEKYQLEDPYELVQNGSWTLDKLEEMGAVAYSDINGNTTADEGDQYGLVLLTQDFAPNFLIASGLRITERNAEGIPEAVLGTEAVVDFFGRMASVMSQDAFICSSESFAKTCWSEGRSLFLAAQFSTSEIMRDLTFDFGVIPYPKYEEAQESYLTTARSTFTAFSIPVTAERNTVAAVLEAMASESYRTVTPAYYEKALKVKYSRDDVSAQMFDIIRDGVCFEFGIFHGILLNEITTAIRTTIADAGTNWATTWASRETAFQTVLTEFVDTVNALEQ